MFHHRERGSQLQISTRKKGKKLFSHLPPAQAMRNRSCPGKKMAVSQLPGNPPAKSNRLRQKNAPCAGLSGYLLLKQRKSAIRASTGKIPLFGLRLAFLPLAFFALFGILAGACRFPGRVLLFPGWEFKADLAQLGIEHEIGVKRTLGALGNESLHQI